MFTTCSNSPNGWVTKPTLVAAPRKRRAHCKKRLTASSCLARKRLNFSMINSVSTVEESTPIHKTVSIISKMKPKQNQRPTLNKRKLGKKAAREGAEVVVEQDDDAIAEMDSDDDEVIINAAAKHDAETEKNLSSEGGEPSKKKTRSNFNWVGEDIYNNFHIGRESYIQLKDNHFSTPDGPKTFRKIAFRRQSTRSDGTTFDSVVEIAPEDVERVTEYLRFLKARCMEMGNVNNPHHSGISNTLYGNYAGFGAYNNNYNNAPYLPPLGHRFQ